MKTISERIAASRNPCQSRDVDIHVACSRAIEQLKRLNNEARTARDFYTITIGFDVPASDFEEVARVYVEHCLRDKRWDIRAELLQIAMTGKYGKFKPSRFETAEEAYQSWLSG